VAHNVPRHRRLRGTLCYQLIYIFLIYTHTHTPPISPALLILAEEVLSRGITELHSRGQAMAFQVLRRCPPVTLLLFTDDTVIFTNDNKNSLKNLRQELLTIK